MTEELGQRQQHLRWYAITSPQRTDISPQLITLAGNADRTSHGFKESSQTCGGKETRQYRGVNDVAAPELLRHHQKSLIFTEK